MMAAEDGRSGEVLGRASSLGPVGGNAARGLEMRSDAEFRR